MKKNFLKFGLLAFAALLQVLPAHATLVLRGNSMVYDTETNLTWMRNANAGGQQTWQDAMAWAQNLVFGGKDDWRLPGVSPVSGGSFNRDYSEDGSTDVGLNNAGKNSELGYLYYVSLGNTASSGAVDSGLFANLQASMASLPYWTSASLDGSSALSFWASSGEQSDQLPKSEPANTWAVRVGDVRVGEVPEPQTLALALAALAALGLSRRRVR